MISVRTTLLLFALVWFGCNTGSQTKNDLPRIEGMAQVTFQIEVAKKLRAEDTLYIAGNHGSLGGWSPDFAQLKVNDGNWENTFNVPIGDLLWKVTRGTWQTEAVDQEGNVLANHQHQILGDTTIRVTVQNWKDVLHVMKGQVTGDVNYHTHLKGNGLLDRDIFVWTPPDYDSKASKRYPVLYMHDGQNLIDPKTSYTNVDWRVDEVADSLIRAGKIEPFILVGINNTADRSAEYSKTVKGDNYMQYVKQVVKPFVDENYRTKPGRESTSTMGASMGGLIAFMLAWEQNDAFGKAGCLSPAFKYLNFDYVNQIEKQANRDGNLELFFYNGGVELEKVLQPGLDAMMKQMDKRKMPYAVTIDKKAEHNEAAWALVMPEVLSLFFAI